MNITPGFRTSLEWKKFKIALPHDAGMLFLVNIFCEIEGSTGRDKTDEAWMPDEALDIFIMAGANEVDGIKPEELLKALLSSGLMVKDGERHRMVSWERENVRLVSNRRNGAKGGRPIKNTTQVNETEDNTSKGNLRQDNTRQRKDRLTTSATPITSGYEKTTSGYEESKTAFEEVEDETVKAFEEINPAF